MDEKERIDKKENIVLKGSLSMAEDKKRKE